MTVFGSVEAFGRGRVEVVVCEGQNSACFLRYLEALERRHRETGREVFLVLDNGPCHTSKASGAALAEREEWLGVIWLARYSPHLNPKEREWRYLKRDARSHLAPTLRGFVDGILAGLGRLGGGERRDIVDEVPDWFIAGHRKAPTRVDHQAGRKARRTLAPASPTRERIYLLLLNPVCKFSPHS